MKFVLALAVFVSFAVRAANPLTDAVRNRYHAIQRNLIDTAKVMPEQDYGFRLTPAQRPFSGWIAHTAMGNYGFCASIRGAAPPDTKRLENLATKAELVKALEDSFAYCEAALREMTDPKALAAITLGTRRIYPVEAMIGLIASCNEHYGNLVGYLRAKGLVPPSSARGGTKRIPERPRRPVPK